MLKGTIRLTNKQRKKRKDKLHINSIFRHDPNFVICSGPSELFYRSTLWKEFRFEYLKNNKRICCLCGQGPTHGVAIQLDHIKPRYIYPELALKHSNIQILCSNCNSGKGLKEFKVKIIKRTLIP